MNAHELLQDVRGKVTDSELDKLGELPLLQFFDELIDFIVDSIC